MKKYLALAAVVATVGFSACSENTSDVTNTSQGQVRLVGEISNSNVSMAFLKGDGDVSFSEGATVDSLTITSVKTLVSRIKLHRDKEDTVTGDRDFKTAPILLIAKRDTSYAITTQPIPPGTYDKIKFEFHKFSGSEKTEFQNDTNYRDFTGAKSATFIIEGVLYKNGVAENFKYISDATANLSLKIEPSITLAEGTTTTVAVRYDPFTIFKTNGEVLDPRDTKNASHIDNMIKAAIRAIKK
ncbi:MAG: hypothetical protein V4642_16300 [Bacteroidota bacterium]